MSRHKKYGGVIKGRVVGLVSVSPRPSRTIVCDTNANKMLHASYSFCFRPQAQQRIRQVPPLCISGCLRLNANHVHSIGVSPLTRFVCSCFKLCSLSGLPHSFLRTCPTPYFPPVFILGQANDWWAEETPGGSSSDTPLARNMRYSRAGERQILRTPS